MSTKTLVAIAAVCVAGAFFAGRELGPDDPGPILSDAGSVSASREENATLGSDVAMRDVLEGKLADAHAENDRLKQELALLKADSGEAPAPGGDAPTEPREEGGEAPASKKGMRYELAPIREAMAETDWNGAGEAISKMIPLLTELALAMKDKSPIPPGAADIQQYNRPLVKLALTAAQGGVPGTEINGSFTHPSIMANLIYSTLANTDHPLDARQQEKLGDLGSRYAMEDERRLAGYAGRDDLFALEKTIEETALKDRFYAEVDAMLTAEQREILHPESMRGRVAVDLFCSGVVWQPLGRPVFFETRQDLAANVVRRLISDAGFKQEHYELLTEVATEWARGFSDAYLIAADDPLARASGELTRNLVIGWVKVAHAAQAARYQVAFMRTLLERLPPDDPAAKGIRTTVHVLIPVKKAAP